MLRMGRCSSLFLLLSLLLPLSDPARPAEAAQDPVLTLLQQYRLELEAQIKEDRKRLRQAQGRLEQASRIAERARLGSDSDSMAFARRIEEQASLNVSRALDILSHDERTARQVVMAIERYERCQALGRTGEETRDREAASIDPPPDRPLPEMGWSLALALSVAIEEWSHYGAALTALRDHYEQLKIPLGLSFREQDVVDPDERWMHLDPIARLEACQAELVRWSSQDGRDLRLGGCVRTLEAVADLVMPHIPVLREAAGRLGLPPPLAGSPARALGLRGEIAAFEATWKTTMAAGRNVAVAPRAKLSECYRLAQQTVSHRP